MTFSIYADENNKTKDGKYELNIAGSLEDIKKYQKHLRPGMRVIFNVQDEFEVDGIIDFDPMFNLWIGQPDYNTKRDL